LPVHEEDREVQVRQAPDRPALEARVAGVGGLHAIQHHQQAVALGGDFIGVPAAGSPGSRNPRKRASRRATDVHALVLWWAFAQACLQGDHCVTFTAQLPATLPRATLMGALLNTASLIEHRRCGEIADGYIDGYVALNWIEWNGGSLRLTETGQNIRKQLKSGQG
jgi:hypothetical protein